MSYSDKSCKFLAYLRHDEGDEAQPALLHSDLIWSIIFVPRLAWERGDWWAISHRRGEPPPVPELPSECAWDPGITVG